jgi:hypothetical protein
MRALPRDVQPLPHLRASHVIRFMLEMLEVFQVIGDGFDQRLLPALWRATRLQQIPWPQVLQKEHPSSPFASQI